MSKDGSKLQKLKFLHILLILFAFVLIAFSLRWQVAEAAKFDEIAKSRKFSFSLDSLRGPIYSQDGTTLAYSEPRFDVYIWMDDLKFLEEKNVQSRTEFVEKVSKVIGKTTSELNEVIHNMYEINSVKWFKIADSLTDKQWEELNNLKVDLTERNLEGFHFVNTSKRMYPENRLAAHVLGLTNEFNDKFFGVGGLEGSYDGTLNPRKGFVTQENNALGQSIATALMPTIEPKTGSSIYTGLDKKLQNILESKMKEGVEKYQAKSATGIIMDPKTGLISALAIYPNYDPNLREEKDPYTYGNIAVSSPYENGSTGKAMTVAAALDLGKITPDETILPNGHNGCEPIEGILDSLGNQVLLCTWDRMPKPSMTVRQCLAESDNICLYHIAKRMEHEDFYNYLNDFGVGKASGIDLYGESIGTIRTPDLWDETDVSAFSYGHGYQLNAIQAISAYGALANNGVRMKPYIVTKIIDSDGKIKDMKPEVIKRVVKPETVVQVNDLMRSNYYKNIASWDYWYQHLLAYDIGVKTGTALIVENGVYTNEVNSTMIGYDMSPSKTFVMFIRLEKPQGERLSYYNVRPLWLETFDAIKDYVGVPRK